MIREQQAFGKNVRTRRKALGLSQEELAEKIDRDPRSIVAIESGRRNPTFSTILKLCKVLEVKSDQLLPF